MEYIKNSDSLIIKKRLSDFYDKNKTRKNVLISAKTGNKNLNEEFDRVSKIVSAEYPELNIDRLQISWGRKTSKRKRSVRFGSIDLKRQLIRIHPLCDDEKIPDHFLRSVIFHEVAHFIHYDYFKSDGFHDSLFYSILKKIDADFEKSRNWEKNNKKLFFTV